MVLNERSQLGAAVYSAHTGTGILPQAGTDVSLDHVADGRAVWLLWCASLKVSIMTPKSFRSSSYAAKKKEKKNPLLSWCKSVILKWIMIECPSITFPGVGLQGSRLGEPRGAPHIHLCAMMSAGLRDICGSVYNITCILFIFYYILSILHTNLFSMSPYGEQYSFFIQKK